MSDILLAGYRPGTSFVHRLTAGTKLVCLAVVSILTLVLPGYWPGVLLVVAALGLLLVSGAPWRRTLLGLRYPAIMLTLLASYLAFSRGWPRALESVSEILGLILLATVLTTTTPVDEVLDTITRALRRVPGVAEEKVALAFSLMIRTIPETFEMAQQSRDAARARGVEHSLRARLIPLVIRVIGRARQTGEALHARGVLDD